MSSVSPDNNGVSSLCDGCQPSYGRCRGGTHSYHCCPHSAMEEICRWCLCSITSKLLPGVCWKHLSDGSISTTTFRKATLMDKYLDFTSCHPLTHKTAVVCTLQHRASAILSTVVTYEEEKEHIILSWTIVIFYICLTNARSQWKLAWHVLTLLTSNTVHFYIPTSLWCVILQSLLS